MNKKNWRGLWAIAVIWMWASTALALSGPQFECLDCNSEGYTIEEPQSGIWYNPERPGTGLALEFQNGIAAGGYYAYDESGDAQWWTFAGVLEEIRSGGYELAVTAELVRYEGGSCLNCEPSRPTEIF